MIIIFLLIGLGIFAALAGLVVLADRI